MRSTWGEPQPESGSQDDDAAGEYLNAARVPVVDCDEPLVDARAVAGLIVDGRTADPAGNFALVRTGILDRLIAAQHLLPLGWRLVLVEGWRSLSLQQRLLDDYHADLRVRYPEWDSGRRIRYARRVVPPPELAPHVTGGAVDVGLLTPSGVSAWMGTEINAFPEDCDGACRMDAGNISAEAAQHRRLLYRSMALGGMVNDPAKWWHWSFGDRLWALRVGEPAARYGPVPDTNGS